MRSVLTSRPLIVVLLALCALAVTPGAEAQAPAASAPVLQNGDFESGLTAWEIARNPDAIQGWRRDPDVVVGGGDSTLTWNAGPNQNCSIYSGYPIAERIDLPASTTGKETIQVSYRLFVGNVTDATGVTLAVTADNTSSVSYNFQTFIPVQASNSNIVPAVDGQWRTLELTASFAPPTGSNAVRIGFRPWIEFPAGDCSRTPTFEVDDLSLTFGGGETTRTADALVPVGALLYGVSTTAPSLEKPKQDADGTPLIPYGFLVQGTWTSVDDLPNVRQRIILPPAATQAATTSVAYTDQLETHTDLYVVLYVRSTAPSGVYPVRVPLADGRTIEAMLTHTKLTGSVPAIGIAVVTADADRGAADLISALRGRQCAATGLWLARGGTLEGYISGAPDFVNAAFPATVAADTPVLSDCAAEYALRSATWTASHIPAQICDESSDGGKMDSLLESAARAAEIEWTDPDSAFAYQFAGMCDAQASGADVVLRWGDLGGNASSDTFLAGRTDFDRSSARVRATITISPRLVTDSTNGDVDPVAGVVLHELGHALGLGHPNEGCTLMSAIVCSNQVTAHERAALRVLYPRSP